MLANVLDEQRLKDEVYIPKKLEKKLNNMFHAYEGIFYEWQGAGFFFLFFVIVVVN